MTVNTTDYYYWQNASKWDYLLFRKTSPNLELIKNYLLNNIGGANWGTYNRRPIKGGTLPSTHSFGAALDWAYNTPEQKEAAIKFLVDYSKELGVQMVADYEGCRIWISKRKDGVAYWKPQTPNAYGMCSPSSRWLHIEITNSSWRWRVPLYLRIDKPI